MIRKGIKFRFAPALVFKSDEDGAYNHGSEKGEPFKSNYVTIYRANKKVTPDCREYVDRHGQVWYLHQVKMTGHSRTNMVYGELFQKNWDDRWYRRIYWVEDGRVYVGNSLVEGVGVHVEHCCAKHGCKYGEKRCPVVIGEVKAAGPCEECENEPKDKPVKTPKFKNGDTIFYMGVHNEQGVVMSGKVWTVAAIENEHDDWACTKEQKDSWQHFGPSGIFYVTCHGVIPEEKAFATKEELLVTL